MFNVNPHHQRKIVMTFNQTVELVTKRIVSIIVGNFYLINSQNTVLPDSLQNQFQIKINSKIPIVAFSSIVFVE